MGTKDAFKTVFVIERAAPGIVLGSGAPLGLGKMNFNFGKISKCFMTGCMVFGAALLQAEGYGLVLVKATRNQAVEVLVKHGDAVAKGTLPPAAVIPLLPGGIYVIQFEKEDDLLEAEFEALNHDLDVELPFTYRMDSKGSGSPIQDIRSPLGHDKWIDSLAEDKISIYFKRGDRYYPLPPCEPGESTERKDAGGSENSGKEAREESKNAV